MASYSVSEISTESTESAKLIMKNVAVLSELSSHLKRETKHSEHCLSSLNSLILQAGRDVSSLHQCIDSLLTIGKTLVYTTLQLVSEDDHNFKSLKSEADNLLNVLDEIKNSSNEDDFNEAKRRQSMRNLNDNLGSKTLIIEEKYPEHCSKESLLDMNNIVALPTVHEDVFADFNRPNRTLSCSSLKSLRKVKMCLQRVSDEDKDYATIEVVDNKPETCVGMDNISCAGRAAESLQPSNPLTMFTSTRPQQCLGHIKEEGLSENKS